MLNGSEVFFKRVGSKRRLAKEILPLFPEHSLYCEVFGGSGNILLRKKPVKIEVFNDIDSDIINIFLAVQNDFNEFARRIKYSIIDRNYFEYLKKSEPVLAIDKAVRAFYLIENSFAGKSTHYGICRTHLGRRQKERILKILLSVHKRIKNVIFECLDFEKFINTYDSEETLFYLDPPYNSKYNCYRYNSIDYHKLYELLKNLRGKFVLSTSDDSKLQDLFRDFNRKDLDVVYTTSKVNNNIRASERIYMNF